MVVVGDRGHSLVASEQEQSSEALHLRSASRSGGAIMGTDLIIPFLRFDTRDNGKVSGTIVHKVVRL